MKKMLAIGIVSIFCLSAAYATTPVSINTTLNPGDNTHVDFGEGGGLDLICSVAPVNKNGQGTLTALALGASLTIDSNPSPSCTQDPPPDERGECVYNPINAMSNMKISARADDIQESPSFGFLLSSDSSTSYKIVCTGQES